MTTQVHPPDEPSPLAETAISALYQQLLDAWNQRNSDAFAATFMEDGESIGFDGSQHSGRAQLAADLQRIFADHATGRYVAVIRSVRLLSPEVAVLRAVVGMVPAGQSDLAPQLNALQSLVAARHDGQWRIALFQNTPAQFHGRPQLAEELTEELQQLL